MRALYLAVLGFCLSMLCGCAELKQILRDQGRVEVASLRRMFRISDPALTLIQHYNSAMERHDYVAALSAARMEIAAPEKRSDRHLAGIRMMAIRATWLLATEVGLSSAMENEVLAWFEQAVAFAKNDEPLKANIYNYISNYYATTNRPGAAISFAKHVLGIWEQRKNPFQTFLAYSNLSRFYELMGDLSNSQEYVKKADELGQQIFNLKNFRKPKGADDDDEEWLVYWDFLEGRMLSLKPGPTSVAEAFHIFSRWERLTQKRINPTYPIYITFASKLIELGQIEPALYYLKRGERTAVTEVSNGIATESSLVCPRIVVNLGLGRLAEAEQDLQKCESIETAMPRRIAYQRYAGILYEATGKLDQAIHAFSASTARCEQMRLSFSVDQRAPFFNNACRLSLLGFVRTLSRRFLASQTQSDFVAALTAAELLRARQFGELLENRQGHSLPVPELGALQQALQTDEILLDYILTDNEIILFIITRERFSLTINPYDAPGTEALTLDLGRDLSTPGGRSASKPRQATLLELGARWVDPMQSMLGEKTRISVLLDGAMYRIPFELLPLDGRPLIEQKTISIIPSLRYLLWARDAEPRQTGKGLLAVADPVFSPHAEFSGITQNEPAITRGGQLVRSLPPLPETRSEAQSIAALFEGEPVRMLLGLDAKESILKGLDLRSYRYLHIATHGLGRSENLDEPALALSGERGEDSVLRASEATELKLQAELTVLSACQTGTGDIYPGEGVMGLSRSFLLAGSTSVLVSLWAVNSKVTASFMVDFYRRLRAGATTASALRDAKLALLHGETPPQSDARGLQLQTKDPYYWAPFVLVSP